MRLAVPNENSVIPLDRKFGVEPREAVALIRQTRQVAKGLGISFHVGSQAADALKHVEAIEACARLLAAARRERLGTLDTLDIGGGFPIEYVQRVFTFIFTTP